MLIRHWLALVLGACTVAGCGTQREAVAPAAQMLVITGGYVVDPTGDAAPVKADIVVAGEKIVKMGPDIVAPAGATSIDARGKYLVPGLWDMHSHIDAVNAVGFKPEGYVGNGVLGVRDMGGHADKLFALKRELAEGRIGPVLVMAGPTLNGEVFGDFQRAVTTPEEGRIAVRELKAMGVDLIKVHRATKRDVFLAIVDEARKSGLPVAGHVPLGMSWVEAADAGMQSIEHMVTLSENIMSDPVRPAANILAAAARIEGPEGAEVIAALARNGTFLDPTMIVYEQKLTTAQPAAAAVARGLYMRVRTMVGRANAAGVAILAGTDVTEQPGAALLEELDLLVASGLSPRQALRAATTTAAEAARRPDLMRIATGAPASFLILDADPSVDIRNVRLLSTVVLRGRVIEAAELKRMREMDAPETQPGAGAAAAGSLN